VLDGVVSSDINSVNNSKSANDKDYGAETISNGSPTVLNTGQMVMDAKATALLYIIKKKQH